MRNIAFILFFGIATNLFGQDNSNIEIDKKHAYSKDSKLRVVYNDSIEALQIGKTPAYFLNGLFTNEISLRTLDSNAIKSIAVEKNTFELHGLEYVGKIKITTKENYQLKLVKIKEFANTYLPSKSTPRIFQIDEKILDGNEEECLIDANYILKIEVNKIKSVQLGTYLYFIRLITKTPENIKKANEIRIRGIDKKTIADKS